MLLSNHSQNNPLFLASKMDIINLEEEAYMPFSAKCFDIIQKRGFSIKNLSQNAYTFFEDATLTDNDRLAFIQNLKNRYEALVPFGQHDSLDEVHRVIKHTENRIKSGDYSHERKTLYSLIHAINITSIFDEISKAPNDKIVIFTDFVTCIALFEIMKSRASIHKYPIINTPASSADVLRILKPGSTDGAYGFAAHAKSIDVSELDRIFS